MKEQLKAEIKKQVYINAERTQYLITMFEDMYGEDDEISLCKAWIDTNEGLLEDAEKRLQEIKNPDDFQGEILCVYGDIFLVKDEINLALKNYRAACDTGFCNMDVFNKIKILELKAGNEITFYDLLNEYKEKMDKLEYLKVKGLVLESMGEVQKAVDIFLDLDDYALKEVFDLAMFCLYQERMDLVVLLLQYIIDYGLKDDIYFAARYMFSVIVDGDNKNWDNHESLELDIMNELEAYENPFKGQMLMKIYGMILKDMDRTEELNSFTTSLEEEMKKLEVMM